MSAPASPGPEVRPGPPPEPRNRSPFRNYLLLLITGIALIHLGDESGFLLFLMLMGAALSYLGDQLGTYCGKNKLSILGLRPKHTANLVNLATGLLITAMTLFGAGTMSENVRIALFRVREIRSQAVSLEAERNRLLGDIEKVRTDLGATQDANATLARAKKGLEEERQALETTNEALAARYAELDRASQTLEDQNQGLETSLAELRQRREALDQSIREKLAEIERLNLALEKKETAPVVISRGQILLDETLAVPMEATTAALQPRLADLARRIRSTVELLDVRVDDPGEKHLAERGVELVMKRLQEIRRAYQASLDTGKISPEAIPRECHVFPVSTRNVSVGEALNRIAFEVRPNEIVFPLGAEVARTVVDAEVPPDKLLDQLLFFDRQVQSALRDRGVSISVLRRGSVAADSDRLLELVHLADRIHGAGTSRTVRCLARSDLYAFGEPVLGFEAEPIPSPAPGEDPEAGSTTSTGPGPEAHAPEGSSDEDLALALPEPTLVPSRLTGGMERPGPPGRPLEEIRLSIQGGTPGSPDRGIPERKGSD